MHMRLFYVPVNNFSFISERFPVFLCKTSIVSSGKSVFSRTLNTVTPLVGVSN